MCIRQYAIVPTPASFLFPLSYSLLPPLILYQKTDVWKSRRQSRRSCCAAMAVRARRKWQKMNEKPKYKMCSDCFDSVSTLMHKRQKCAEIQLYFFAFHSHKLNLRCERLPFIVNVDDITPAQNLGRYPPLWNDQHAGVRTICDIVAEVSIDLS